MRRAAVVAAACALAACSGETRPDASAAVESGRAVYTNVCVVCHHADPRERGALGPPLAGAALELLEAKVLRGEYPPGYTPKQAGATMPRYEFVAPKLADVAAYLASVE
jgi:mono/diheme cytochrome c family protein